MKIRWSEKERELLSVVCSSVDAGKELNDNDLLLIEESVSDYLVLHCLDFKYSPTEQGKTCESILDKLR